MTRIIVTAPDGVAHIIEAADGLSVMEVLRPLDFGISGDCEGSAACASCHVWIAEEWMGNLPEPSEAEAEMLDCAFRTKPTSRLCCQIRVDPMVDGLRLVIPHD
jgi:2Fe-2S ferredoxin